MPVHLFGQPATMQAFAELCARRGLILLEDAAQAHGAAVGGRPVGSFGTAAFSFFATKNMTTLEGGMVLTNDAVVLRRLRQQRNHGRDGTPFHEVAGSNFRMSELAAAIGLVQLGRLPELNARRRANAERLSGALDGVVLPREVPGTTHVFHQYTVRVRPGTDRDAFVDALNARGIGARVYYPTPIHRQPALVNARSTARAELPQTERASREVLSLPVHPGLDAGDLDRIRDAVNDLAAGRG
jgi:perosamine synthetase